MLQLTINGLIAGCLYALMALGFSLIYNATKIFHFAHAGLYVLTAYCFYTLYFICGVSIFLSIIASLLMIGIVGVLTDVFLYKPLEISNSSLLIKTLSSLGIYMIIVSFLESAFSIEPRIIILNSPVISPAANVYLSKIQLINLAVSLIVLMTFFAVLYGTAAGKIIRAMRDNSLLLSAVGFNVSLIRCVIFAIGTIFAGIAAILSSLDSGIEPHMGMPVFTVAVVATIIGNVNSLKGALVGAIFIGLLQSFSVLFLQANWRDSAVFLTLLVFLLFNSEEIFKNFRRVEKKIVI